MGRSIALSLAQEGVDVAISDIDEVAAGEVAAEARTLGVKAIAVRTDVASLDSVRQLADTAYREFGTVDILVNNAGVTMRPFRASWDSSYEDFQWVMNVNWWGVLNGFYTFVPRMRQQPRGAHIVNTSSMTSFWPMAGHSAYSASKAAVDGFSQTVRAEFIQSGTPIGVSILFPGSVRTRIPTSERLRPEGERSEIRGVKPWSDYVGEALAPSGAEGPKPSDAAPHRQAKDPDSVGPLVVDGIKNNYQFISTHPAPREQILDRAREMADSYHGS